MRLNNHYDVSVIYVALNVLLFKSILSLNLGCQNTSLGRFPHSPFLKPHYTSHKILNVNSLAIGAIPCSRKECPVTVI